MERPTDNSNEHKERIPHLLDAVSEAKIYAGAEFEALCNEQKFEEATMFCLLRDLMQAQRVVLSDYIVGVKEWTK